MSKTSQENKAKKAKKELAVEVQDKELEQKAVTKEAEEVETKEISTETAEEETSSPAKVKVKKVRSKNYLTAKKKVKTDNYYPIKEAVKLVKDTSLSKFIGKIEAHIVIAETGSLGEINFPHLETASKKVVILNDTILKEIKDGQINFDILIATPATMPKLLPLAKVLGPKGLMPNPKNGTLTDKTEAALKKLSATKTILKTEKQAPVLHLVIAKTDQPTKEIEDNLNELFNTLKDKKIKKATICATMGPSVKIKIDR
jgi:large subunit ribosomal protein L1